MKLFTKIATALSLVIAFAGSAHASSLSSVQDFDKLQKTEVLKLAAERDPGINQASITMEASATKGSRYGDFGEDLNETVTRFAVAYNNFEVSKDGLTAHGYSIGIEKLEDHDPALFGGYSYGTQDADKELTASVGFNTHGAIASAMVMKDVVENEDGGLSVGFQATVSDSGAAIGPVVEVVGKQMGFSLSAIGVSVVERTGDQGQYRKRYSLNPFVMLIQLATGSRTALHVLAQNLNIKADEVQPVQEVIHA